MNIARYAEPELHFKYGKILNEVSSVLGSEENWYLARGFKFRKVVCREPDKKLLI